MLGLVENNKMLVAEEINNIIAITNVLHRYIEII